MPFDQSGSGGGGGGSSFAPGGMTSVADPGTAAVVKISYTPFVAPTPQPVPTPPQLPTVTITKPANVAKYVKGQRVVVAYTCSAVLGNTIKSCVGTVPNGGTLPTSKPGLATFKVTATTTAGLSASQTVTYRVIVPTKKKGIATTVTLDYAKKLTLTGTLVGSLGTPKLELPFKPCKTATFTSCTSSSGSSFTLRARLSNRKLATVTALVKSKQSANRGTVKTTVKSSGTTVTLNYTMDSPRVAKLDTPKHGSGQLVKIRYSKLAPGACKPAGSC
jgi:hypothetical protein